MRDSNKVDGVVSRETENGATPLGFKRIAMDLWISGTPAMDKETVDSSLTASYRQQQPAHNLPTTTTTLTALTVISLQNDKGGLLDHPNHSIFTHFI